MSVKIALNFYELCRLTEPFTKKGNDDDKGKAQ